MLKAEKTITEAICDACGKDLRYFWKEDQGKCRSANYGEVLPHFGYGSNLDGGDKIRPHYILCEDCFAKALHAVNLPVEDLDPVVCPVCRKPRNGRNDHPECMKGYYPHPDSEARKEADRAFEEHRKRAPLRNKAFWWRRYRNLKEGGRQIASITPEMVEGWAKHYKFDTNPPTDEEVKSWEDQPVSQNP